MNKKSLSPFQRALLDAQLEQWKDIPSEKEMEITLSAEFQKKGNEMICRTKRGKPRVVSTTVRQIAFVAAVLAVMVISTLAIPYVREGLVQFFVPDTGDHYPFDFDDALLASAPEKIEKVYKPTYIPVGFREEAIISTEWVVYMWQADGEKMITFGQYPLSNESVRPLPNAEGLQVGGILADGYKVLSMNNESSRMYFWTDNEYFYRLICSNSVPTDESNKMLNNIRLNKNAAISLWKEP